MNVKTNDPKDEELARRFQEDEMRLIKEDEERKKKQLSDSEFARKMYEDEMRLIKEDEERKKNKVVMKILLESFMRKKCV